MAYDQSLAARVRRALTTASNVVEKPMFGGLTFMIAGNMCCGLIKDELMIRVAPETTLEALASPYVRVCKFTSRPMRGLFVVSREECANQRGVNRWVKLALQHNRSWAAQVSNARPMRSRDRATKQVRRDR